MVKYNADSLSPVFSALADPTRRAILARLEQGETTVGDLASPFGVSLPAISKHLRVLENAGLINRRVAGRTHHCSLNPEPLQTATEWLGHYRRFWEPRLDSLANYLDDHSEEEPRSWNPHEPKPTPLSSSAPTQSRRAPSSTPGRGRKR